MRRYFLIAMAFIALPMSAMGQLIPLLPEGTKNQLWLDPDRVFDYNQYEKSRWGAGLQYDINFDTTARQNMFRKLSLGGYGAYGYADQRWKWGVKADLQWCSKRQIHSYMEFSHDLSAAASRILSSPALNILQAPASIMTRLFSDKWHLAWGFSDRPAQRLIESFELHLSHERPLYDSLGNIFYPTNDEYNELTTYNFAELQFTIEHTSGWSGRVTLGTYSRGASGTAEAFLRTLVQYKRTHHMSFLELQLFGQGGIVEGTDGVPYSRMFDLGGSWSSPLFLNHALLTARQNEFTTNIFALVTMKLTTTEPLFSFCNSMIAMGSSPRPFVLCNAAWGQTSDSHYQAPDKGIAEVGAGIDGLVVWGQISWGLGVAYRLTPESGAYHFTDRKDNMTLLLSAYLNL